MFFESKTDRDAAFTVFMAVSRPSLMRTAWLLTGSADRAHELVQAALVKTYVSWHRIDATSAPAYARRILVNQSTDTWRATRSELAVAEVPERPSAANASVEDRDHVVRMLAILPTQQRRVVVLRYYNDLSEQQTADALGISVGAVKSAASRGLAALRAQHATTQQEP